MNNINWNDDNFVREFLEEANQFSLEYQKKPKKDLYKIVINYQILMERLITWSSHQDYNFLVQKFLNKKINGFEFQDAFLELWYSDRRQMDELIETIEDEDKMNQIPDFSYTSKSIIFSKVISNLFFATEGYESEENESKLRSFIEEYYFPTLREHFDDSFFPPKIGLDQLIARSYKIFYSIAIIIIGFLLVSF
uniref:hypothetical protein n=1 Tax=Navicula tsukamotoi TaxID=2018706 RepID=UPI002182294B|nr:hypothetical protein NDC64_pgp025 [Navicula tsukamotoi]UVG41783.1 hypothetical protein [Navicula tsukamotoi]UVG41928.1 hypothetical protein [Navicula tsukamotoi]